MLVIEIAANQNVGIKIENLIWIIKISMISIVFFPQSSFFTVCDDNSFTNVNTRSNTDNHGNCKACKLKWYVEIIVNHSLSCLGVQCWAIKNCKRLLDKLFKIENHRNKTSSKLCTCKCDWGINQQPIMHIFVNIKVSIPWTKYYFGGRTHKMYF